jgi:hypothetical protein
MVYKKNLCICISCMIKGLKLACIISLRSLLCSLVKLLWGEWIYSWAATRSIVL